MDSLITVRALRPAAGGETLAHHDGRPVFLSGALPGEEVTARVTKASAKLLRAEVVEVLEASAHRVPDRRAELGAPGAGGVEFAHTTLAHSRTLKAEAASAQLSRLGGIDPAAAGFRVLPAPSEAAGEVPLPGSEEHEPADAATRWRTRVQLAVDAEGRAGMYAAGSHAVIPLQRDVVPLAVGEISGLGLAQERFPGLRRLEIACAADGLSGAVVLRGPEAGAHAARVAGMSADWAGEWSVLAEEAPAGPARAGRGAARRRGGGRNRSGGRNRGGASAGGVDLVSGSGLVTERVPGLGRPLRVSGAGFWQVHRDAAGVLAGSVRTLLDAEALASDDTVLDLYCGAGLLGIALAEDGHRVLGVEGSAEAIERARENARGLDAEFRTGRVERLGEMPAARAAVLDPPRAGAGAEVVAALTASAVETLVYVSCDPATFARDAAGLRGGGFELVSAVGHDLFPLTGHLELVSLFRR
ncbi:class I SAM-dependent RNA methyltransferase [Brevibacterium album]|uniref:class I SAM-dependent RNA methyltransferase n=1 Tax=Brevibacterium album TaxID=417948 RepID=UPI000417FB93|nr:methyltransferase domain-containing protein [Brevibacterium album]